MGIDRESLLPADLLQLRHQLGFGLNWQMKLVDPVAQIVLRQLEGTSEGGRLRSMAGQRVVREYDGGCRG